MVNSHLKLLQGTEGDPQEKAGLAALAGQRWRFEKAQNAKSMVNENENMDVGQNGRPRGPQMLV